MDSMILMMNHPASQNTNTSNDQINRSLNQVDNATLKLRNLQLTSSANIEKTYRKEVNKKKKERKENINKLSLQNRPSDSRWKQQKLPAWQPVLKPTNVIVILFLFGLICLSLGVLMYLTNKEVQEHIIDYTDCKSIEDFSKPCSNRWKFKFDSCKCRINFTLSEMFRAPLFLYYSLEGFYQNHRRYMASIDHKQLMGEERSLQSIRSNCYPYSDIQGRIIAPCGAIANSMFMDKFAIHFYDISTEKYIEINIKEKEISWPLDRFHLFKNPLSGFKSFARPINWSITVDQLDQKDKENNGYQNEHFMVWMRVAAFPTFRKLWGRIEPVGSLIYDGLPAGLYQLQVDYNFVTVWDHLRIPKKVIISNMSWMGGKNYFLPIVYLVTGALCIVMATFLTVLSHYTYCKSCHDIHAIH